MKRKPLLLDLHERQMPELRELSAQELTSVSAGELTAMETVTTTSDSSGNCKDSGWSSCD